MKQFAGLVENMSRVLDRIAAFCIAATMMVVVINVLLRVLFRHPLVGTMDYVNILTALTIGLAIAFCGLQNGHIAVDFIIEKFPEQVQELLDIIIKLLGLVFWGVSAWYMAGYAQATKLAGLVASTTQIPMYPVLFLIAFGLLALCLVLVLQLTASVRKVIK